MPLAKRQQRQSSLKKITRFKKNGHEHDLIFFLTRVSTQINPNRFLRGFLRGIHSIKSYSLHLTLVHYRNKITDFSEYDTHTVNIN